jgi:hypothetical protein
VLAHALFRNVEWFSGGSAAPIGGPSRSSNGNGIDFRGIARHGRSMAKMNEILMLWEK